MHFDVLRECETGANGKMSLSLWLFGDLNHIGFNEIIGIIGVFVCSIACFVSWYQIRRDAQNQTL